VAALLDAASASSALGSVQRTLQRGVISTSSRGGDGGGGDASIDWALMDTVQPPSVLAVADAQPKLHQMRKLLRFFAAFRDDSTTTTTTTT
jgi:hypothetical protein